MACVSKVTNESPTTFPPYRPPAQIACQIVSNGLGTKYTWTVAERHNAANSFHPRPYKRVHCLFILCPIVFFILSDCLHERIRLNWRHFLTESTST